MKKTKETIMTLNLKKDLQSMEKIKLDLENRGARVYLQVSLDNEDIKYTLMAVFPDNKIWEIVEIND